MSLGTVVNMYQGGPWLFNVETPLRTKPSVPDLSPEPPPTFALCPPMLPSSYPGCSDFETGKKLPEVTLTAVWARMHYNAMSQLQYSLGDTGGRPSLP